MRVALTAAYLMLSACAGTGVEQQQPTVSSPPKSEVIARPSSTASRAAQAAKEPERTPTRRLAVAVLDPAHYQVGKNEREEALIRNRGFSALPANKVGYYMEVEEAELRRRLSAGTKVRIIKQDKGILIGPIGHAFASGSIKLEDRLRATLDAVTPVFREFVSTLIIIHAYTDSTGSAEYNRKLSEERAMSVANYLLKGGIASDRIAVVGHGSQPTLDASGRSAKGRAENRRITIEVDPLVP